METELPRLKRCCSRVKTTNSSKFAFAKLVTKFHLALKSATAYF